VLVAGRGTLHHLELWVADLAAAEASLGWLLVALGWQPERSWPQGRWWWRLGETHVVVESGPDVLGGCHERRRPGLDHLTSSVPTSAEVDELVVAARRRGWSLLFADRHPHAGGPQHYAAYFEDAGGFEVELVP
jgi:probable phosphoglycerate mutase